MDRARSDSRRALNARFGAGRTVCVLVGDAAAVAARRGRGHAAARRRQCLCAGKRLPTTLSVLAVREPVLAAVSARPCLSACPCRSPVAEIVPVLLLPVCEAVTEAAGNDVALVVTASLAAGANAEPMGAGCSLC